MDIKENQIFLEFHKMAFAFFIENKMETKRVLALLATVLVDVLASQSANDLKKEELEDIWQKMSDQVKKDLYFLYKFYQENGR